MFLKLHQNANVAAAFASNTWKLLEMCLNNGDMKLMVKFMK